MNYLSLLLAICLTCAGPGSASAQTKAVRIMPLGDSLTMASPGYRGSLFRLLSGAGYKVEFVGSMTDEDPQAGSPRHEGHGGFTIGPGKSKADAWSNGKGNLFDNLEAWLQVQPEVILLLIGTNDYFNIGDLQPGYRPDQAGPGRLGALLDKIHALSPASKVVVSSIMPVEWDANFARPFNQAIPQLVAARPFTVFADLNTQTAFQPGDWSGDKLHPSDQGYQKIAQGWFEALKTILPPPK